MSKFKVGDLVKFNPENCPSKTLKVEMRITKMTLLSFTIICTRGNTYLEGGVWKEGDVEIYSIVDLVYFIHHEKLIKKNILSRNLK